MHTDQSDPISQWDWGQLAITRIGFYGSRSEWFVSYQ